jgi:glycosyltransferase involved in cell wall biosynthesis
MPVRDAAATLAAALDSVLNQTFTGWELIAANDGSTDASGVVLEEFARRDPRIRTLHSPPRGIVHALNDACAAARAPLIARMDADDRMLPQRLERQLRFLESHPEVGVVSSLVRFGGDATRQAGYAAHVAWMNSLLDSREMELRRFVEAPVAHPSVLFRRELLHVHGGYRSGDFPEDYELWLRWMEAGVRFAKLNEKLLVWNDPPQRLSRRDARYRTEAFYRLKCHYLARWLRTHVVETRRLWLWGAGRITRQRFAGLDREGAPVEGYIDVDPKKLGRQRDGRPVVGPRELPPAACSFIIAGVATRGARDLITAELQRQGRGEGSDFLLAA